MLATVQHYWKYNLWLYSDSKTWHLHVERFEIDSLSEVYYSFTSSSSSPQSLLSNIISFLVAMEAVPCWLYQLRLK